MREADRFATLSVPESLFQGFQVFEIRLRWVANLSIAEDLYSPEEYFHQIK